MPKTKTGHPRIMIVPRLSAAFVARSTVKRDRYASVPDLSSRLKRIADGGTRTG
jgi:hypothetical protein